jgi:hypothetical protein
MAKSPTVDLGDILDEAELTTYAQTREQEGPKVARDMMLSRWQKELDKALQNLERARERQYEELWDRIDSFWSWFRWVLVAVFVLWLGVWGIGRGCAAYETRQVAVVREMADKGFINLQHQEPGSQIKGAPEGVKFVSANIDSDDVVHLIVEAPAPPSGQVYTVSYAIKYQSDDAPEASGMFVTKPGDGGQLRFEKKHELGHYHYSYEWISVSVSLAPAK